MTRGVMIILTLLALTDGCVRQKETMQPVKKVTDTQGKAQQGSLPEESTFHGGEDLEFYWRPEGVTIRSGDIEVMFWIRERPAKDNFPFSLSDFSGRGKESKIITEMSRIKRTLGAWRLPTAKDMLLLQEVCRRLERMAGRRQGPAGCETAWAEGPPKIVKGVERRKTIHPLYITEGELCAEYDYAGVVLLRRVSDAVDPLR